METDLLGIDAAIEKSFPSQEEPNEPEKPDSSKDDAEEGEPIEGEEKEEKSEEEDSDEGTEKGDETDKKADEQPPKKKEKADRFQKRIDDLTREKYEYRRRIEDLERRIEERPPELPPQPDPRQFATADGQFDQRRYDFAMGQWQAIVNGINAEVEQRGQRRFEAEKEQARAKIAADKGRYEDFDATVRSIAFMRDTPELITALRTMDNATDVLYFLGKNPRIADQIDQMHGTEQAIQLATIGTKLKLATERKTKRVSSAPPPPAKVKGKGPTTRDFDKLDFADHVRMMQEAEKRLAKKF